MTWKITRKYWINLQIISLTFFIRFIRFEVKM